MKVERLSRAVATVIAVLAVSVIPAVAQVGHSPFQPPATPIASDAPAWQVTGVIPLDIEGTALALSPDGSTIAGLEPDGALCFWSVPGLERTCTELSEGPPDRIDPDSIAWAPDSSAVAYSVLAYLYITDGDIYVVDVESLTTSNITDDGIEEARFFGDDAEPTPVDVMPAWTPDSQSIVFSRTVYDDREELSNEIMRVSWDGGDAETLLSLPGLPASVFLPMRVLSDGSIVYNVGFNDTSEPTNGLWILSPDGEATQVMPGVRGSDFPLPVINDVREVDGEVIIIGHSAIIAGEIPGGEVPFTFVWSSATGEATPVEAGDGEVGTRVYAGALSPDGQTTLAIVRSLTSQPRLVLQGPESSELEVPEVEFDGAGWRPRWNAANWSDANLVLVTPLVTSVAFLVAVEPS